MTMEVVGFFYLLKLCAGGGGIRQRRRMGVTMWDSDKRRVTHAELAHCGGPGENPGVGSLLGAMHVSY